MTDDPYRKTLPGLPAATEVSDDLLLLARPEGATRDHKLRAAVLAAWVKEKLGLPTITVGTTPPENPQPGDIWIDSN